jgi:hypothetical protein
LVIFRDDCRQSFFQLIVVVVVGFLRLNVLDFTVVVVAANVVVGVDAIALNVSGRLDDCDVFILKRLLEKKNLFFFIQ